MNNSVEEYDLSNFIKLGLNQHKNFRNRATDQLLRYWHKFGQMIWEQYITNCEKYNKKKILINSDKDIFLTILGFIGNENLI